MLRCRNCDSLLCFRDMRGIKSSNPKYDCTEGPHQPCDYSMRQLCNRRPRTVHLMCAVGRCYYFDYVRDKAGGLLKLKEGKLGVAKVIKMRF